MKILLKNANIYGYGKKDILTDGEVIAKIEDNIIDDADKVYDFEVVHIFPDL